MLDSVQNWKSFGCSFFLRAKFLDYVSGRKLFSLTRLFTIIFRSVKKREEWKKNQKRKMDSKKDVVRSSVKVPEFDKHRPEDISAETMKMKTIAQKPLMMKIIIIMLRHQHGYPWPSTATLLYRPSLPVGL